MRIALVGDHDPAVTAHRAIPPALALAGAHLGLVVEHEWVPTDRPGLDQGRGLDGYDALWCVPASPYRSMEGALGAIRWARESGRPFLGTCGGCQHALIEYARDVLGLTSADHEETAPDAELPLISRLACSLVEVSNTIALVEGTRVREIYGTPSAGESYHCNFGLNPRFERALDDGALRVAGRDESGEVRAVELATHPFFVATLFQPERSSLRGERHPLITAFVSAAAESATSSVRTAVPRPGAVPG